MKRILYLSFYFEPDLCAGSFRNTPLAKELSKQLHSIANVDVITTIPNRYQSFTVDALDEEVLDNLFIRRIRLPIHKSKLIDQMFAFWKYYRETLRFTRDQNYDLVFASSSKGFTDYFSKYSSKEISYFTNGIDNEFIQSQDFAEFISTTPKLITYAGNIGEGQGLHKIIPTAAKLLGNDYQFRIIGDGGAKELLVAKVKEFALSNVSIEPPVKRNALLEIYKKSSFLFLHLNDYDAFEKVLPSKIFELAAFPRPMIAGVSGYAQDFIQENIENSIIFKPSNAFDLVDKLQRSQYKITNRMAFINKFSRDKINEQMSAMIISYL